MADSSNDKKFMRETIVKPKETKSRLLRKITGLVLFAVLFGIVSAISFVMAKPVAEKYLGTEPPVEKVPITIEKDDEPDVALMETMESTTAAADGEPEADPAAEPGTEPVTEPSSEPAELPDAEPDEDMIRMIVQEEMAAAEWTTDKLKAMNRLITEIGKEADKSIVTVSAVKHQIDWFDNQVESAGQFAGTILAVNPGEIVILTGEQAIEDADALRVTFHDGTTAAAWVKQTDSLVGMATIAVNPAELSKLTREVIEPIELGNSYSVQAGDLLIAVGSPAGRVYSLKHGAVTYVAKGVQTADGQTRVLYTDMDCDYEKGTFFLNLSGQLVGWGTTLFDSESTSEETLAMPVSEYKGNLQKLSNGIQVPYLGIKGQEVTGNMQDSGIPNGIYITETIADSPAYLAGIQSGDILLEILGSEITTIRDLQNLMEGLQSGAEVILKIARKGINEYKVIEYHVTIGAR